MASGEGGRAAATRRSALGRVRGSVALGLAAFLARAALATATPPRDVALPLQHWGSEAGLAHNSVYALLVDRVGFLWIGTVDGLDRFDGYDFVHYRHDPRDATTLGNQIVRSLAEDGADTLWVGTDDGVSRLDRRSGSFASYRLDDGESAPGGARARMVWSLYLDREGTLWAGTDRGLFVFDRTRDRFFTHALGPPAGTPATSFVWGLDEDAEGALWALTGSSEGLDAALHRLAPRAPGADAPIDDAADQSYRFVSPSTPTQGFLFDRQGRLWIRPAAPARLDAARRLVLPPATAAGAGLALGIFEDASGDLWFGSEGRGVLWLPARGGEPVWHLLGADAGWFQNAVRAVAQDRSGALWFGTYTGIYRYDPAAKPFQCLRHERTDERSLSSSVASALWQDGHGALWVGTFGGGLNQLDLEHGTAVRFRARAGDRNALRSDVVWAIRGDARGRLWLATDDGLCSLDPERGRFAWHELPGISPRFHKLLALALGEGDRLWIGSPNGVHAFEPATGAAERFDFRSPGGDPIENWVDSLLPDGRGGLWLGTGFLGLRLRRFDPRTRAVVEFPLHSPGERPRVAEGVWMIHRDARGRVWSATGAGLVRLDPESGEVAELLQSDGLPAGIVYGILEDDDGRFWLSTDRGLSRFDERLPAGRQFRNFDRSDGLCGNEFNRGAALRLRDGRFAFGGVDGVTLFDPEAIHDDPTAPPLALTAAEVSSRDGTRAVNPHGLASLALSWRDTSFALTFAELSFGHSERNRYAYQLSGLDPAWVEAGNRRFARYTSVPPGAYVFRVRAANPDGVWGPTELRLPITVAPPFWATAWFRLAAGLALAGGLWLAIRLRVRRLLELERLRLRIAGDLHDDLSTDLAGIAMVTDVLRGNPALPTAERAQLAELRDHALQMVEAVRDTVWYVNPEHDSLEALVRRMRRAAAQLLAAVPYRFSAELGEAPSELAMATRRGLFLIFKELLHNAARHSRASAVEIAVRRHGGGLSLTIADDGVGFDTATATDGMGLGNLRRRAQEIGAELSIDARPGAGTRVELRLALPGGGMHLVGDRSDTP